MNIARYMEEVRGNFSKCPVTEETSTFCTPTTLIPKKYMNINEKVFFAKSNGIILHRRLIYDFRDNGAWYFDPTTASDIDDKLYVKPIISPIIPEARVINLDTQKNIALPISAYPFICIGYFMLQINSNTDLYDTFLEFLGSKELNKELYLDDFYVKKNGTLCGCNKVETVCSSAEKAFTDPILVKNDVGFKLGMSGETPIVFSTNSGYKYYVVHYEEGTPLSSEGATMVHIVFKIYAENRDILQEIICEIKNIQTIKPSNKIRVFIKGPRASWKLNSEFPKRGIESVFHESQDEVLNDIEKFLKSEEEYVRYGIPYKRNYLFHGKPGTGKTSFITSVASKYNFDIYFLTFDSDLDDKSFKMLVSSMPNNGILVIEDVHTIDFSDSKKPIGLSSILNTLDGLSRKNRLLSFMTTNYFDKLEPVLTRPGRIDKIIEFKYVNEYIFKKMFETFYSDYETREKIQEFWTKIKSKKISPAILQKYLFENRDVEDITSKESLKIFYNLLEQYTPKDQYESNRLYM